MDRGLGEYIGMIAVGSGAVVLALSYLGAYLVGRSHGRRDEMRTSRVEEIDAAQRLAGLEATVRGINSSVERLMDAQRLLVAQQDHLSRKVGVSDRNNVALPSVQGRHTPS
jgi:hypothetical protein